MRDRFYVGCRLKSPWEVFKCSGTPTTTTHGHLYFGVIGPFRTKRGAEFMAKFGRNNPHCLSVSNAEKLAKHQ